MDNRFVLITEVDGLEDNEITSRKSLNSARKNLENNMQELMGKEEICRTYLEYLISKNDIAGKAQATRHALRKSFEKVMQSYSNRSPNDYFDSILDRRYLIRRRKNRLIQGSVELRKQEHYVEKKNFMHRESPEDFNKRCTLAKRFVYRMRKKKALLEQGKLEHHRISMEKEQKTIEEINKRAKEREELSRAKHKQQLLQFFANSHKKRQQQQIQWQSTKRNFIPKAESYLYKKSESRYKEELNTLFNEKQRTELSRRKNMFSSIASYNLEVHKKVHEEKIIQHKRDKEKELEAQRKAEQRLSKEQLKFHTNISQRVKIFDRLRLIQKKGREVEKKLMRRKMQDYSEIINEVYNEKGDKCFKQHIFNYPVRNNKLISGNDTEFPSISKKYTNKTNYQQAGIHELNVSRSKEHSQVEEKYEEILSEANRLVSKAKDEFMKLTRNELKKTNNNPADTLINSLKAKLAMLGEVC